MSHRVMSHRHYDPQLPATRGVMPQSREPQDAFGLTRGRKSRRQPGPATPPYPVAFEAMPGTEGAYMQTDVSATRAAEEISRLGA
jgi:hypothetical protein